MGWFLGGLVLVALAVTVVVTYLTMRRGVRYVRTLRVDGRIYEVSLHFNHWFPRWRRVFGFTLGGHVWFRDSAPDSWQRASGVGSLNPAKVQREMVAHELAHIAQEIREGRVRFLLGTVGELATQWVWRRRGHEEAARRQENPISQGSGPVAADWLADFPNDWPGSA